MSIAPFSPDTAIAIVFYLDGMTSAFFLREPEVTMGMGRETIPLEGLPVTFDRTFSTAKIGGRLDEDIPLTDEQSLALAILQGDLDAAFPLIDMILDKHGLPSRIMYHLFAGNNHYPEGGFGDIIATCGSLQAAKDRLPADGQEWEWAHIVRDVNGTLTQVAKWVPPWKKMGKEMGGWTDIFVAHDAKVSAEPA